MLYALYCWFIITTTVLFPIHKAAMARLRRETPRIRELISLLLVPAIFIFLSLPLSLFLLFSRARHSQVSTSKEDLDS